MKILLIALVLIAQTPYPERETRSKEIYSLVNNPTGLVIGADWADDTPVCIQRTSDDYGYWCASVKYLRYGVKTRP